MNVAVVGDDAVADAVADAGGTVVTPDTDSSGERADVVVAVGDDAFVEAARERSAPVLPVDCDCGPYSVPPSALDASLAELVAGEGRDVTHRRFAVAVEGEPVGEMVFDAMLVTSEPARISEYVVSFGEQRVTSFRADGVVAATPLGSHGYGKAAGGPVLEPGAGLAVVPVAPFATRSGTWVARDDVRLTVARDDGPVSLVLDGRPRRTLDAHDAVECTPDGSVDLRVVPRMQWD